MGRTLNFAELSGGLDLESALIYDAVHLLAVALGHLRDIQRIDPYSIDCGSNGELPDFWQHGSSILNFMRVSHIPGLSRSATVRRNNYLPTLVFPSEMFTLTHSGDAQDLSWIFSTCLRRRD